MTKDLVNKPEYFDLIINYLADPLDNRNYDVFAQSIGISHQHFYNIRRQFKNEIEQAVKARRQEMIDTLRSQAWKSLATKLRTDLNAVKLFFQLSGDLIERTEVSQKYETLEEKRSRLDGLLKTLNMSLHESSEKISNKQSNSELMPASNQTIEPASGIKSNDQKELPS